MLLEAGDEVLGVAVAEVLEVDGGLEVADCFGSFLVADLHILPREDARDSAGVLTP